jgi:hypothetical protein
VWLMPFSDIVASEFVNKQLHFLDLSWTHIRLNFTLNPQCQPARKPSVLLGFYIVLKKLF